MQNALVMISILTWSEVNIEEFAKGVNVELEHGFLYAETNVTNDDSRIP